MRRVLVALAPAAAFGTACEKTLGGKPCDK
jgi:hypothetical protein